MKALFSIMLCAAPVMAQVTIPANNVSIRQEVELSYQRGLAFLNTKQNAETGQWGDVEPVAFTALALASNLSAPGRKPADAVSPAMKKGFDFLLKNVQPDGGIYVKARSNYNTALALMALVMHPQPELNHDVIVKARRYLVGRQLDLDTPGVADNPLDGGVGYGDDKGFHADLSNMHFTLQALKYAESYLADKGSAAKEEPKLNFAAAIDFIARAQNMPTNKQPWVSTDKADEGGFIYGPTETRGPKVEQNGRVAMRSYGSISYAGLMSYIYAGLDKNDPRVTAAVKWLSENFTMDENPGMGAEGQYYYYHTMAKSLAAAEMDKLTTKDGKQVEWRGELVHKLVNLQQGDGSWANAKAARWMESDQVLVTTYVLQALAHAASGL
jgi:squalene-hopene/tetraprenyl-beta-curcumene cyclase